MWIVMGAALVVAVALYPLLAHVTHVRATLVFVMLPAWARNSAYREHRRDGVRRRKSGLCLRHRTDLRVGPKPLHEARNAT